jgi:hypothetical protein
MPTSHLDSMNLESGATYEGAITRLFVLAATLACPAERASRMKASIPDLAEGSGGDGAGRHGAGLPDYD